MHLIYNFPGAAGILLNKPFVGVDRAVRELAADLGHPPATLLSQTDDLKARVGIVFPQKVRVRRVLL
jgi:hypothetical protein